MNEKFELIYGYRHCRGETTYSAGFAGTEEEAREWVRARSGEAGETAVPPAADPVCTCEAALCPLKFQAPWYSYRVIP